MKPALSIIIPVYFNAETLEELHRKIIFSLQNRFRSHEIEILFVDDGSLDNSFEILCRLAEKNPNSRVIRLSRNFGSHAAVLAGLKMCRGNFAAMITADLQDSPEIILKMHEKILEDRSEAIFACRSERQENWKKIAFANLYYWMMRTFSQAKFPPGGFDCFLISRKVIDALVAMRETNTSLPAQILWMGFRQSRIEYVKQERPLGKSRWTTRKKIKLLVDSLLSFSHMPIRLMEYLGLATTLFGFFYAGLIIFNYLLGKKEVEGWASLMVAILFFSGIILSSLGIIGEYLWRTLDAARQRPVFFIEDLVNFPQEENQQEQKGFLTELKNKEGEK